MDGQPLGPHPVSPAKGSYNDYVKEQQTPPPEATVKKAPEMTAKQHTALINEKIKRTDDALQSQQQF